MNPAVLKMIRQGFVSDIDVWVTAQKKITRSLKSTKFFQTCHQWLLILIIKVGHDWIGRGVTADTAVHFSIKHKWLKLQHDAERTWLLRPDTISVSEIRMQQCDFNILSDGVDLRQNHKLVIDSFALQSIKFKKRISYVLAFPGQHLKYNTVCCVKGYPEQWRWQPG